MEFSALFLSNSGLFSTISEHDRILKLKNFLTFLTKTSTTKPITTPASNLLNQIELEKKQIRDFIKQMTGQNRMKEIYASLENWIQQEQLSVPDELLFDIHQSWLSAQVATAKSTALQHSTDHLKHPPLPGLSPDTRQKVSRRLISATNYLIHLIFDPHSKLNDFKAKLDQRTKEAFHNQLEKRIVEKLAENLRQEPRYVPDQLAAVPHLSSEIAQVVLDVINELLVKIHSLDSEPKDLLMKIVLGIRETFDMVNEPACSLVFSDPGKKKFYRECQVLDALSILLLPPANQKTDRVCISATVVKPEQWSSSSRPEASRLFVSYNPIGNDHYSLVNHVEKFTVIEEGIEHRYAILKDFLDKLANFGRSDISRLPDLVVRVKQFVSNQYQNYVSPGFLIYAVLVICRRHRHEPLPTKIERVVNALNLERVDESQRLAILHDINNYHAEQILIKYLSLSLKSREIIPVGVDKPCCLVCAEEISKRNQKPEAPNFIVDRCHGTFVPSVRPLLTGEKFNFPTTQINWDVLDSWSLNSFMTETKDDSVLFKIWEKAGLVNAGYYLGETASWNNTQKIEDYKEAAVGDVPNSTPGSNDTSLVSMSSPACSAGRLFRSSTQGSVNSSAVEKELGRIARPSLFTIENNRTGSEILWDDENRKPSRNVGCKAYFDDSRKNRCNQQIDRFFTVCPPNSAFALKDELRQPNPRFKRMAMINGYSVEI